VNDCYQAILCDGISPTCKPDSPKGLDAECNLTSDDLAGVDVACVDTNGKCDDAHDCKVVPLVDKPCVPNDVMPPDPRCVESATCDATGNCHVAKKQNGKQCGTFCDDSICMDGACVEKPEPHPCGGSSLDLCNPLNLGKECVNCGNGTVDAGEQCDDGNRLDNDGCTANCQLACDPSPNAAPDKLCAPPVLTKDVPDPCRQNQCLRVVLNPGIPNAGFACTTVALDCMGCLTDLDCRSADGCEQSHCEQNKCTTSSKDGVALAACGFEDPFPGDELSTDAANDCSTMKPADGSVCAPDGGANKPRTLCKLARLERGAKTLLDSCNEGQGKAKKGTLRRIRHLLKLGVFRANSLRSPFRRRVSQECSQALTARLSRLIDNLQKAEASGWSCR